MTVVDNSRTFPPIASDERGQLAETSSRYQDLADWLTCAVARYLGVPADTIDVDTPLADYGLDSAASLGLCADLQSERGIVADTTIVWDYPTIDAIATHLVTLGAAS